MVYAGDLKSPPSRVMGSSPISGTTGKPERAYFCSLKPPPPFPSSRKTVIIITTDMKKPQPANKKASLKPRPKVVTLALLGVIALFLTSVFIYHKIASANELNFLSQFDLGQTVEVDGKKVNYKIFNPENANKTIVLMPGLTTQDLAVAFQPLAEKLNARIILINRPGYAFSEETGKEATVDYIIDYHRKTLTALNISTPVILMPHSIAGQYAIYWAEKYPSEVSSIIGLDIGSPFLFAEEDDTNSLSETIRYLGAKLGLGRIVMGKSDYAPLLANFGYFTDAEIEAMWYLSGTINPYPKFAKSETLLSKTNAKKVVASLSDNYYSKPKLLLYADYQAENFKSKVRPILFTTFHNEQVVDNHIAEHKTLQNKTADSLKTDDKTKIVTVPGTHALYLYPSETLISAINDFLLNEP